MKHLQQNGYSIIKIYQFVGFGLGCFLTLSMKLKLQYQPTDFRDYISVISQVWELYFQLECLSPGKQTNK